MISGIVSRLFITLPSIDNAPQGTMGVWGKGHDQLKRKPFIYNPSLNRQAPQGISKNQRNWLFSVPAGPSKILNGMGVWGKGHDHL